MVGVVLRDEGRPGRCFRCDGFHVVWSVGPRKRVAGGGWNVYFVASIRRASVSVFTWNAFKLATKAAIAESSVMRWNRE